jgi:hypothetical protein
MSELMDRLKEAKAKIAAARKDALEVMKGAFSEASQELFAANPLLESFGWRQYTPYFNDGDECTFRANTDFPYVNGLDEDDYYDEKPNENTLTEEQRKSLTSVVRNFLDQFSNEDFKDMFGDHVKVTAYKDRVDVEDYNHD